jgi:hypothetical protein
MNMNKISTNVFTIQATPIADNTVALSVPTGETPNLLPGVNDLLLSGDPGAMMAALTMQSAHDEAKAARQQRQQAEVAQEAAEHAEIQDIRDKATLQLVQGVVSGVLDAAQGACQLAAGLNDAHGASEKAEASAEQTDLEKSGAHYSEEHQDALTHSIKSLNEGAASSTAASAKWNGVGSAAGAAKTMVGGAFNFAIANKEADEKMHASTADTFKRIADDAHDDEKDAKDLLSKALDFYKEYVDTKNQTALAATHRA